MSWPLPLVSLKIGLGRVVDNNYLFVSPIKNRRFLILSGTNNLDYWEKYTPLAKGHRLNSKKKLEYLQVS